MCRGNSLSRLIELENYNADHYILVNQWDMQLTMPEFQFLLGADIQHYINREPHNVLTRKNYSKYGITKAVLNIPQEEVASSAVAHFAAHHGVGNIKGMSSTISKWAVDGAYSFPSMGVQSLVHIAACEEPSVITVVGMDFFEDDYYTFHSSKGGKKVYEYQKKKNSNMKSYVVDFIKENSNISFRFITNAKFENISIPSNMLIL